MDNIRSGLAPLVGKWGTYTATVSRFSVSYIRNNGNLIDTVMFSDVKDASGNYVADHFWQLMPRGSTRRKRVWRELQVGDVVQFEAKVGRYQKHKRVTGEPFRAWMVKEDYTFTDIKDLTVIWRAG